MRSESIVETATAEEILGSLSPAQSEVMDRVVARMTSKEIARELNIAPSTVDQRVRAVLSKLGARDRDDAALRYAELHRLCGRTIYGSAVMDVLMPAADDPYRELPRSPHFTLEDSMVNFPSEFAVRGPTFLEAFDRRFGRIGRLGLVIALAVMLAVLALTTTAIGTILNKLV